jgi:hypothetical protein
VVVTIGAKEGAQLAEIPSRAGVPVKVWAAVGAVFLAAACYTLVSWMLSSDFRAIPQGVTPLPGFMRVSLIAITAVGPILVILAVYGILVKPWHREGRMRSGGMPAGSPRRQVCSVPQAGSVWTADVNHGVDVARRVRVGSYGVNTYNSDVNVPFRWL